MHMQFDATRPSEPPLSPSTADDPVLQTLLEGSREVQRLLDRQAALRAGSSDPQSAQRTQLARRLCIELVAQMHLEEELLYPRLRRLVRDTLPIDQSEAENECLRDLALRLEPMDALHPMFDARVQVLAEVFDLHHRREIRQVYPLLLGQSWPDLAQALRSRRQFLLLAAGVSDILAIENEEADPVGEPPA